MVAGQTNGELADEIAIVCTVAMVEQRLEDDTDDDTQVHAVLSQHSAELVAVRLLSHHDYLEREYGNEERHDVLEVIGFVWLWLTCLLVSIGGFCRLLAVGCLFRPDKLLCLEPGVPDEQGLVDGSEQVECRNHVPWVA
jgi:hypothetical protein